MLDYRVCRKCSEECEVPCAALRELMQLYAAKRAEEKHELLKALRATLGLVDFEVADDLRELGERVIAAMPELSIITECGLRVAYVRAWDVKRNKGSEVMAECRRVTGSYQAFLPYDFIVTVYQPSVSALTKNQMQVLMLHELRHIGIGPKGPRIEPHDVEDFRDILQRYGIEWNGFGKDIPDIVGGDSGQQKRKKTQGMATSNKTSKNGRTPAKSGR